MAADAISTLLQEILSWMDAHDDVLPTLHTQPSPAQQEEKALKQKYKDYLKRAGNLTRNQRQLQQEIDLAMSCLALPL